MKMIYIVQGQSTGSNGGIIHWADNAYADEQKAINACSNLCQLLKDDPNGFVYITGPIALIDKKREL